MSLLKGAASFNGASGEYSVVIGLDFFEREIRIGSVVVWDSFRDGMYWQSDFGSPIYRRPSPFSTQEGMQWLAIWKQIQGGLEPGQDESRAAASTNWKVGSMSGSTSVEFLDDSMKAVASSGNVIIYGPATLQSSHATSNRPAALPRLDFRLPFDLSMGVPRAQIMVGGKPINVMIDTGCDHSLFATSLAHEPLGVTVKVGGAGGVVEMEVGRLLDVDFGGAKIGEITPFFMAFDRMPRPLRLLRGIIGQDILGRSEVTFDQRNGVIVGTSSSRDDVNWPLDGSYTKAMVDGREGWYRIDTGSAFTLHQFSNESSGEGLSQPTHHGIGGAMRVKPLKIDTIRLDQARFSNIKAFTYFTDEDREVIAGNIGNQLLKDLEITLDFARGSARFRSIK